MALTGTDADAGTGPDEPGEPDAPDAPAPPDERPTRLLREIYRTGLAGRRPRLSTDLTALAEPARRMMSENAYGFVTGSAGTGAGERANREAFGHWRLLPRVLRGAHRPDLGVSLFGQHLPAPVLLAPVAALTLAHPEGELAAARAAADADVPLVLSSNASFALEEVANAAGGGRRWFQFYWPSKQAVAESLVRRAEAGGYTALVLTVDASYSSYRPTDLDHGYLPFLHGAGTANFTADPAFLAGLPDGADDSVVREHWRRVTSNPALAWEQLPWLRGLTTLPLQVKGILHPDDARRAVELGADGVIVSNHGGRQLDGTVAALDVLAAVRAAVGRDVPVLLDSGVRTGVDVVKALALGADAILYGRPYVFGLALDGQRGVAHVLGCLLAELESAMTLAGCASVADLGPDLLVPPGPLPTAFSGSASGPASAPASATPVPRPR